MFQFSPAISFFVSCTTQQEVDLLWEKLSEGGKPNRCGWLDDKFGITWQIIPSILSELIGDADKTKANRAMQAMFKMDKIDIAALQKAHAGN
jgi:predicted 3-demethylubiquinone-9 3-methyltransferase (glyoxalase superfamily)